MACPSTMAGSSPGETMRIPSRRARASACASDSHIVSPSTTTRAPSARTAATLRAGAPTGTTTVTGTSLRAPAQARDWAWLPVEAVTTPRRRSSGLSAAMSATPPRTLKAPVGWTFSCLTVTSTPASALSSG